MRNPTALSPILYLPHGGGPMPLLGDPGHQPLVDFLQQLPDRFPAPEAILLISAHWEAKVPTLTSAPTPSLIYDYYGFPAEAYEVVYPVAGEPDFAMKVRDLLSIAGIDAELDSQRGFDHGVFVPLKLMYPQADIPCVQLSLVQGLDAQQHIDIGKALAPLRESNVLVIGSGMSFHNIREFMSKDEQANNRSHVFSEWLIETLVSGDCGAADQERRMVAWKLAPSARFCHPREEHLLPLHVCFGMAVRERSAARVLFDQQMMGKRVISLLW